MPGSRLRSNKLLNISNIDVWSPNIMNVVDIMLYTYLILLLNGRRWWTDEFLYHMIIHKVLVDIYIYLA